MDTYADDLAALIDHLDLNGATLVGHSTSGGEVAHYIGRHGTARVAKAVLIGAVPPLMLQTAGNPDSGDDGFDQGTLRLHQAVFGSRLDRRPEENERPHADPAR